MASGDTIFILEPGGGKPPSANFATLDTVADASTPNMEIPVLDFDGTADEFMDWFLTIPSYYSGATGFTFSYKYAMDGTDGNIIELEFKVLPISGSDILTADLGMDTQTPVSVADNPDVNANEVNYTVTGALAKANFGSAAAGKRICIRVMRDVSIVANADDLQLISVLVEET